MMLYNTASFRTHLSSSLYRNLACVRCSRFPGQYAVRNAQFSPNTNTIPQSEDYATRLRGYNFELTSIYTNLQENTIIRRASLFAHIKNSLSLTSFMDYKK